VKNSRTRLAAFGVGVNNGAAWRFGEGARMISVIMRWISATFLLVPCPVVKRVIKDVIRLMMTPMIMPKRLFM
jgi:hypothetical protein